MRLRLFFTIFAALAITAISISGIHYHFFKLERLRLIELNLQQNVSLLKNADLTMSKSEYSIRGKEVIDQIIGDDKINMIVAIYGKSGNVLYFNENAHIFEVPSSLGRSINEWEDVETKDYFIKYLTVKDQLQGRTIRVGMILNQSLLRWKDLNQRIFIYASIVLTVIILISFFLTQILFRPVQILADQVSLMGEKIEKGEFNDLKSWFSLLGKNKKRDDEFGKLILSLDKLAHRITDTQEQTQKWSAMMAHELKTPMTILRNRIDDLTQSIPASAQKIAAVEAELEKLEAIIMDFLEWASLENDASSPELHAIPLVKRVTMLAQSIEQSYPNQKIEIINLLENDQRVFCNPLHFDQVINNLLVNSVKYGAGKVIVLEIAPDQLTVTDGGPGLPDTVLENFGKPFNRFKQGEALGYGLGLAWVNTISKKYQWKLVLSNKPQTTIKIVFPQSTDT